MEKSSLGMAGGTLSESAGFAYRPVGVKRPQAEPPDHIRDGRERRVRLYLQGSCMQLPRSHDFDSTRTLLIARAFLLPFAVALISIVASSSIPAQAAPAQL